MPKKYTKGFRDVERVIENQRRKKRSKGDHEGGDSIDERRRGMK